MAGVVVVVDVTVDDVTNVDVATILLTDVRISMVDHH